ncbi:MULTISPECIES: phenylacetate--CoA ligase PaaK [Acinetobacter]|uniref:Phenylacetate-coenzyme A ligase n=1 Tax=Acinetobacter courvalinii TaxID=280147 RepID=A0AA42I6N0_9GAMM|nr:MULTISPECIES: phenylacetate--CoA ligase PaaK [Acinetobacter]EKU51507.1 phenylacetate-CoA ligase [Acinetobacter sp. WC-323]ENX05540.1 phenylacetate-CoA ligase [Acinetobacter courvalinii]MCU4367132.1 phenylacetate--CoA ligase [Acinetobacter courvalinii]MCU4445338.1 phenylacetate--CoA ligase [Acinetobacter courvalinii]MCU4576847.1 phenylacetate--CoA ligase [Acinetobacter courvalinii]
MDSLITEDVEKMTLAELRALQTQRLKQTLTYVYANSPVYKKKFDDAGVHPDDFVTLDDLAKFPFTTKQDLRDNYPFGMFAVPQEQIVRLHASSGTTGKPTVVGYTQKDINTWSDIVARCLRMAGLSAKDMIQVAYGYGLFTGGLGAHYGAERLGATVIPMSGGQTEKQVQLIQDFKPTAIMVTPSYCVSIIEKLEQQLGSARNTSLKVGIFGAEPWSKELRREIEERLNIKALDIYGLSEIMGPGVAMQCLDEGEGLTIWEDHFYPEIINPETGEVCKDGELGELVFTTITKEGLPIIRYRTRDLTRLLAGQNLAMRRMDKIVGRSDDMLIIRGVNVFPTQIEEQILQVPSLVPNYEILVAKQGHMDTLHIRTEMCHNCDLQAQQLAQQLMQRIKTMIGISVTVEVVNELTLPRSEGKAKRVIDMRQIA